MFRILAILLLSTASARAEPLTFIALAKVRDAPAYDRFIEEVTPIWSRHGMRALVRLRSSAEDAAGINDISVIAVDDRSRFRAYLEDPAYRTMAPRRIAALDNLTIVEGRARSLPRFPAVGSMVSVVMQSRCAEDEPGAAVALVAPVKGTVPAFLAGAGCIRFLSADDAPTSSVLAGFAAVVTP